MQLRNQIVHKPMSAGETLPSERLLSEALGVNRGAVREGLKRLQQAGLVSIRQGGATVVNDFMNEAGLELLPSLLVDEEGVMKIEAARAIIKMRQTLAPDVARQAARNGDPDLHAQLDALVEQMQSTDQLDELQDLAFEYWTALTRGCGNLAYRLAFNSLRKTYKKIWGLLTHAMEPEFRDVGTLAALNEAIANGEPEKAAQLADRYVQKGSDSLERVLQQYASQGSGKVV